MKQIRILLADDHTNVRKQIETRLKREQDMEIVGEATSSDQMLEIALARSPQVILCDPAMQDGLGLEAVRNLAGRMPCISIVVLTAFADTATRMELRKLGVRQILTKGIDSELLIASLREAVATGCRLG